MCFPWLVVVWIVMQRLSLARARKVFATARMLGFSFKFLYGKPEQPWEKN